MSERSPVRVPLPEQVYVVRLCSGESRRWRFLGPDSRGIVWWRDEESGRSFTEASVMYVWEIVSEA